MKERCKAKAKATAKAKAKSKKQSGLLFFGLDVFLFGVAVFLFPSMAIFLFLPVARQLIESGPSVCWVPVPISGNAVRVGSSGQTRIRSPD